MMCSVSVSKNLPNKQKPKAILYFEVHIYETNANVLPVTVLLKTKVLVYAIPVVQVLRNYWYYIMKLEQPYSMLRSQCMPNGHCSCHTICPL